MKSKAVLYFMLSVFKNTLSPMSIYSNTYFVRLFVFNALMYFISLVTNRYSHPRPTLPAINSKHIKFIHMKYFRPQ